MGSERIRRVFLIAGGLLLCAAAFLVPSGLAGSTHPHAGSTGSTGSTGSSGASGTTGSTHNGTGFGDNGPFGRVGIKCKRKGHGRRKGSKAVCFLTFTPALEPRKVTGFLSKGKKKKARGKAMVNSDMARLILKPIRKHKKLKKGTYKLTIFGTYADGGVQTASGSVKVG